MGRGSGLGLGGWWRGGIRGWWLDVGGGRLGIGILGRLGGGGIGGGIDGLVVVIGVGRG